MPIPGLNFSDEQLFPISNFVGLPAWILLLLVPRWHGSGYVANVTVLALAALYGALIYQAWMSGEFTADFFTLQGVIGLFSKPQVVYAGWVHYAAGDLWLGKCIAADAVARGFPQLLLIPILIVTMMLAPVGLLLYYVVRVILEALGFCGKAKLD